MSEAEIHISIQKRQPGGQVSEAQLRRLIVHNQAVAFDLPGDTQVQSCYFFPQAKQAIFDWAAQSLEKSPVVEVGGFLLGQYARSTQGKYLLVIMHFLAAREVSFQSANRLRLGAASMLTLNEALEMHPTTCLLGWFHTHPGHTPFFSDIDMASHQAFFKANHHIAVVTDPCLATFPTVILSKKMQGDMTTEWNQQDWITWKEELKDL